jgi:hypothetical protein
MSPRTLLPLVVLFLACQKNVPTKPGTETLRWERAQSSRPEVVAGKEIGTREKKDVKVVVTPDLQAPLTLKVHMETARVELTSGGKVVQHTTPVDVRVTVEANTDWTTEGKCTDGPHFQMGPIVDGKMGAPEAMLLQCSVKLQYKSTGKDLNMSTSFDFFGDGRVVPSMLGGSARVEP